jgi:hypothetical protein
MTTEPEEVKIATSPEDKITASTTFESLERSSTLESSQINFPEFDSQTWTSGDSSSVTVRRPGNNTA